ncbi:MAG: hypothetical protein R2784_13930 [Saprospiraceae bacterium]
MEMGILAVSGYWNLQFSEPEVIEFPAALEAATSTWMLTYHPDKRFYY